MEYLEYSSSLYHKPIHFFTFTLELIFTFHCPKAMRPHDTALVHVTCHIPWYPLHPWQGQWWHYMSHACWHVSHGDRAHNLYDMSRASCWHDKLILIFTCDTDRGCRAVTARHMTCQLMTRPRDMWRCDGGLATGRLAPGLLDAGHQTRTQCLMLLY